MNRNVIIILVGGFVVAMLVAMLMQAMLGGSKKSDAIDETRVQILVAAKDLSVGKELKEGDLKWKTWPEEGAFMGAIIRDGDQPATEAAQGKLLRSLSEGQPMHMSLLVEDNKGDFLSANVVKGMRAVGISVKSHVLADRLVRPGDYVDVMVTYRVRVNTRNNPDAQSLVNRYATETIIENVRVLAIDKNDTKAVDEAEDGKKKSKKKSSKKASLTLEVTSDAAEALLLADKMGDIGIALRSIGDVTDSAHDQSTTDIGMSKVMTKLSKMTGTSSAVRVYSGDVMNEVRARQNNRDSGVEFDVTDDPLPEQRIIISPDALQPPAGEE
jgi:pilus assembly protein CpaB